MSAAGGPSALTPYRPLLSSLVGRGPRLARRLAGTIGFVARLLRDVARRSDLACPLAKADLLARTSGAFCRIHDVEVVTRGTMPPGPKVIVMNHLGYLDPLVLAARFPVLPIAKSEIASWPMVGRVAAAVGVMFIRRGHPESGFRVLRTVLRNLAAGASVLNFPEGTTSRGEDVLPFHRGIFGAAQLAGVPVVPVRLSFEDPNLAWVDDEAFVPHYAELASRPSARVFLEVLDPIDPASFSRAKDLAEAARGALRGATLPIRAPLAS